MRVTAVFCLLLAFGVLGASPTSTGSGPQGREWYVPIDMADYMVRSDDCDTQIGPAPTSCFVEVWVKPRAGAWYKALVTEVKTGDRTYVALDGETRKIQYRYKDVTGYCWSQNVWVTEVGEWPGWDHEKWISDGSTP
jgi:hypothetical protein